MRERVTELIRWIEKSQDEWRACHGGFAFDVQGAGNFIAIASLDSEGAPVLSLYLIEEVEHAIAFAEKLVASGEQTSRMLAFGAGQADWVDRQIQKEEVS